MDPSEVEFMAEKEKVAVLPNFSENKIYLIGVSTAHGPVLGWELLVAESDLANVPAT